MKLTLHANKRAQQRCIPPLVIEWLLSYGKRENSFGCNRITFDKRAKKLLSKEVGEQIVKSLSKYLSACIVVDNEDIVVTTMWLH